jgi:hypothetical protein
MILACDTCDAVVDQAERGWRAYSAPDFVIACPDCAERHGEDETPVLDERPDGARFA